MGYNPLSIDELQVTTPSVINEIKSGTSPHTRIKIAINARKLDLREPSPKILKEIINSSIKIGDFPSLSKADMDVLALSLELQRNGLSPILVSDDYAIQNVAEYSGLRYTSLMTFGIRYRFEWLLYCPACKRRYTLNSYTKVCNICGNRLKRRVIRKTPVNQKRK